METVVPSSNLVSAVRSSEHSASWTKGGEDGHGGKVNRSCKAFSSRTPTSYPLSGIPQRIQRTPHGPTELHSPYLWPTSSEFQNRRSMDLICVFSIYILNPLITPLFLYFLCHPLFKPSLMISLFTMMMCLFLISILRNALIESMLHAWVLTHIPSYHVFIVLLSLSSCLRNADSK